MGINGIDALKHKKFKEAIHPFLLKIMTSKTTGDLVVDGELPKDEKFLIVANHLCIEDIPTLGQAVQDHIFVLVSDEDKKTLDGLALSLNGVQWVTRLDKESRKMASQNAVNILKSGEIFAMYPEATWNLSPNLLMLPMNYGCIKIALESNVPIVPVVTFFSSGNRYTIIGEKYYPVIDLEYSISELRDIMATMIYTSMEKYYKDNRSNPNIQCEIIDGEEYFYEKREDIDEGYWEQYVSEKYDKYARARKDKSGVREFESQFIFTPKTDDYSFFQLFNSVIRMEDGKPIIKRISSEKNGYNGTSYDELDYNDFFGYGYNEKVLKLQLKK